MNFRNISSWCIKNPVPPIVLFIGLMLAGLIAFSGMSVNNNPDIDFPAAEINISQPGAAPTEMESQITQKVEAAARSVTGVDEINSTVREGSSSTTVQFVIGTSTDRAINDLRDAITDLRLAGAHLVLATGRSVHATAPVAHELGLTGGWAVCSNGAVTVRLDPDADLGYVITDRITFDPGPALRLMHAELPDAHFAVEDLDSGFRMNKLFPAGELTGHHEVVDLEDLWSDHVTRLVVRSPGHTSTDFHELVHRMGLDEVTYAVGWTAWMDIAPKGVTKASALEAASNDCQRRCNSHS